MKKWWFVVIGLGAVALAVWLYQSSRPVEQLYETTSVTRSAIENVVSVTGHVEPINRVTLSFQRAGRIAHITVAEGERVEAGEMLASLDQDQVQTAVDEARARAVREEATLTELTAPLNQSARAVRDAALQKAEQAELASMEALRTQLARAYSVADDAIREKSDELFATTRNGVPKFGIGFSYGTTEYFIRGTPAEETRINEGRSQTEVALVRLKEYTTDTSGSVDTLARAALDDLAGIELFLNDLSAVVNTYVPDDVATQAVYEGFQNSLSSARTALSGVQSEVRAGISAYEGAVAAKRVVALEYAQVLAGATDEAHAVQEASLNVARLSIAAAVEAADTVHIYAPLDGIVARVEAVVGETVGAQNPIFELHTVGSYEVEVYIPEADVARVKIGDQARITFDAFSRDTEFAGEVVRIALAETVREGVPTYKTTLVFSGAPPEGEVLRAGMTADVDITTDRRENALSIATRSIVTDGARTYVRVLRQGGTIEERDVVVGLRGSEGATELLSGVVEGEEVVLFVK